MVSVRSLRHRKLVLISPGPIIRVNPWEVHINDPEFYDSIYTSASGFDKVHEHLAWTNGPGAAQSTIPHALHKLRRTALNPLFSKKQIKLFAPEIQDRAARLCNRFHSEYKSAGKVLRLDLAFGCFAMDVVTEYAFAREYKYMDYPEFIAPFVEMGRNFLKTVHTLRLFPILRKTMTSLPNRVATMLNPKIGHFFSFQDVRIILTTDKTLLMV